MKKTIVLLGWLLIIIPVVYSAATLEVSAFACSPGEVVINNQFTCTATVENTGDATGTLNTATLYPDSTNWLVESSYAETVNANMDSGTSTDVVFSGLKGKKSGDNGFSKIMLDDVTDTYVADNSITVNVIDVVITTSHSADSAASDSEVDVTAQVTSGGNVDIELTFSVISGGCSIGNQASSVTITDLSNGQTTSHTWTLTIGSANCVYSISAKASSNPSKTDSASSTISCSNCGGNGGNGGTGGTGSSAGGGGAAVTSEVEELLAPSEKPAEEETPLGAEEEAELGLPFKKEKVSIKTAVISALGLLLVLILVVGVVFVKKRKTPHYDYEENPQEAFKEKEAFKEQEDMKKLDDEFKA